MTDRPRRCASSIGSTSAPSFMRTWACRSMQTTRCLCPGTIEHLGKLLEHDPLIGAACSRLARRGHVSVVLDLRIRDAVTPFLIQKPRPKIVSVHADLTSGIPPLDEFALGKFQQCRADAKTLIGRHHPERPKPGW